MLSAILPIFFAIAALALGAFVSGIVGILALTNLFGINYESAGRWSFLAGLILSAALILLSAPGGLVAVGVMSQWIIIVAGSVLFLFAMTLLIRRPRGPEDKK